MKITIIHAQNHKGSSYTIGMKFVEELIDDINELNEIILPNDLPKFCIGCAICILKDEKKCPHYQDLIPITTKIDEADLLIFTTPVYVKHIPASLKVLLDHYAYRWMVHRPEEKMFHKQAICIATAAGYGMNSAIKDIKDSLSFWGVPKIYSFGVAIPSTSWNELNQKKKDKINKKVHRLSNAIEKGHTSLKLSLKTKALFYLFRSMQTQGWNQVDSGYWKEKGWLEKKRPWK